MNLEGIGLGLSICKNIVKENGGSITVSSEGVGQGTTFAFYFNLYSKDNSQHEDSYDPDSSFCEDKRSSITNNSNFECSDNFLENIENFQYDSSEEGHNVLSEESKLDDEIELLNENLANLSNHSEKHGLGI